MYLSDPLISKWIKHITVQEGYAHASGWNVTSYLQFKTSFFSPTQSETFPLKVFQLNFKNFFLSKNQVMCRNESIEKGLKNTLILQK